MRSVLSVPVGGSRRHGRNCLQLGHDASKYRVPLRVLIPLVALPWLWTAPLSAQAQGQGAPPGDAGPSLEPAYAGDCVVVVRSGNAQAGSLVGLEPTLVLTQEHRLTSGNSQDIEFPTTEPLQVGHQLRLRLNGEVVADATVTAPPANRSPTGRCEAP